MTTSKSRVIQGRESRRRESVMTNDPRRHSQTIPAKKLKKFVLQADAQTNGEWRTNWQMKGQKDMAML